MRNAFHIMVSLLMWCLFGYYWLVVSTRQITRSTLNALEILGVVILLVLIITFWWVAHNKKLARRNRRNTAPITPPETFATDYLGRPLVRPDVAQLQMAGIIDITIAPGAAGDPQDPGQKIYSLGERDSS